MRKFHSKKLNQDPLYQYDSWTVTEDFFDVDNNHHDETIFSLGNGYMGVRGTFEEDYTGPEDTTTPGVYVNGVYASEKIIYGEEAPNQPEWSQTILNLADWTEINLYLDGEKFDMLSGELKDYRRYLDMRKGKLVRRVIWQSPGGKLVRLEITRLVSFEYLHLGLINYRVTPLNFSGELTFVSGINGDVRNHHHLREKKALSTIDQGQREGNLYLLQEADSTGIYIATAINNVLDVPENTSHVRKQSLDNGHISQTIKVNAPCEQTITLEKYANLYTSRDVAHDSVLDRALNGIKWDADRGTDNIFKSQAQYLEDYWYKTDIRIEGDVALQQGFRFNAFHLLQSTGRDGLTNIAAKGLTGEFYEGHYFWDTETYILPYFLYNIPEIARELLFYRFNILDKARANARRIKLDGALFPWRTINGDEASGFFMGSTVQYHIDADIAYAIHKYVDATGDKEFLYNIGAEILMETARMWASRGNYIEPRHNQFCINEVCGPDEYKPGVNNNCYTNHMAKFNLEFALEVVRELKEEHPEKFEELKMKLDFEEFELVKWERAAREMYLPFNEDLRIHPQDDSFIYKDPIDIDEIPDEELPLVSHWHPLTIWRYQVIKQPDVILLMLLLGDKFDMKVKKNNYDYYEPKTTHDSSLSPAVYSIIASEIGYFDDAYDYFMQTARLDLDDYNENTYKGIHTACMGSTWMALVQGFAGMRNYHGELHFNPYLPEPWEGYEFNIVFQGQRFRVRVDEQGTTYNLLEGEELTIFHRDEQIKLQGDRCITRDNRASFILQRRNSGDSHKGED